MSDGSPSLLNSLRRFRFQKKPGFEIGPDHSMSSDSMTDTSQILNFTKKHVQRLDSESEDSIEFITVLSEDEDIGHSLKKRGHQVHKISDSEDEDTKVATSIDNIHQISDSDDDIKIIQKKNIRCIVLSDDEDDEENCEPKPDFAQVFVDAPENGTIVMNRSSIKFEKNDDVICIDDDSSKSNDVFEINGTTTNTTTPTTTTTITTTTTTTTTTTIEDTTNDKRKKMCPTEDNPKGKKRKKLHSDSRHFKEENVFDSGDSSDEDISNVLTPIKRKVLDYLSNGTEKELRLMPSCSQKKLDEILELRPFTGWVDLVTKFQNAKFLGTELLNAAQQVINAREVVSNLMKKCERIASQTENAIAAGATGIKLQPSLLNPEFELKSYQMVGLNWLAVMRSQELNGILADEMGLGKTIQVIAFLAYLKENKHNTVGSPHLIVVPTSTLENWWNELEKWCPMLTVAQYYGNPDERRYLRYTWMTDGFGSIDIILTTYNMVSSGNEEKKMFRVVPFHYVVFDEAHMLKNMNTQRYENLFRIKAGYRILLTGTPLQNNLLELMSLLVFVMPDMFAGKTDYLKFLFSRNAKSAIEEAPMFEQEQVERAKRIMKPFVLRRLKNDVLSDLPKKTNSIIKCDLEESQAAKYEDLFEIFKQTSTPDPDYNYMSIMMQLRKMANHPLTLRYLYEDEKVRQMAEILANDNSYKEKDPKKIFEDLVFMSDHELHQQCDIHKCLRGFQLPDSVLVISGKMKKLDEILPRLKEEGHRVLLFSQFVFMLDILEDYMRVRGHSFLRLDGQTPVCERQDMIDLYNKDSSILAFLLSTRAGGVGINLTAADTVIIHDIDYNPYNDKQAEDRCHRMGQTRPVNIMRFVSKGTVEETILKVAQEKLLLEKEVTTDKDKDVADTKTVLHLIRDALGIKST